MFQKRSILQPNAKISMHSSDVSFFEYIIITFEKFNNFNLPVMSKIVPIADCGNQKKTNPFAGVKRKIIIL